MSAAIFCAGIFHETHSFLDEVTEVADFRRCGFGGSEPIAVPGSPMAGAVGVIGGAGFTIQDGPYWMAMPSGTVADSVLKTWQESFREAWKLRKGKTEGIFLVLHGAMCTEKEEDAEARVVEWIRTLPGAGALPIFAVLDLHGNISPGFCAAISGCVAYRENPHADAVEAAKRSAQGLVRTVRKGVVVRTFWQGTSFIWPPSGTGTADSPMVVLERMARRIEEYEGVVAVSVFAGYSYSDTVCCGPSFALSVEEGVDQAHVEEWLLSLSGAAVEWRDAGYPQADTMEDVMRAMAVAGGRPVLVAEPSDNIGAGAPGDTTGLLREFLEQDLEGAGVILNDPVAVQILAGIEPGQRISLGVGGRGSRLDAGPVEREWELIRLFRGAFNLEDPRSHLASMLGTAVDMGACALIRCRGITVLLTSLKTPPFDLGQWRVAGVDPENFQVIGVKAAVGYRQAYDPIAAAHFTVDTPGPCSLDL
ncbi:MAG: M81 family metallopeptidase, partial [Puniceicoccales bacterium]